MAKLDWYIRANLKLRHLQLLVALDDLRSIGRAAAYLNVTQPAVSKTLTALEEGLEVTLFERTTRGLEPTGHGACLIRHARVILDQLCCVRDDLHDISAGRIARVSLGVLPAAAAALMPRFVARLEAESVETVVSIREDTTNALLAPLRTADIDFIVGNLPPWPLGAEFASELLYEDPLVAVVRRGHPLAGERRPGWARLNGYPVILPPEDAFTRLPLDDFMARHGIAVPRHHIESLSTLTSIGVLQLTHSVGFLARSVVSQFAALGLLVELPLVLPNVGMRVGLIWLKERHKALSGTSHQLVRRIFHEVSAQVQVPWHHAVTHVDGEAGWEMF